jgi:hypothetical protein
MSEPAVHLGVKSSMGAEVAISQEKRKKEKKKKDEKRTKKKKKGGTKTT